MAKNDTSAQAPSAELAGNLLAMAQIIGFFLRAVLTGAVILALKARLTF